MVELAQLHFADVSFGGTGGAHMDLLPQVWGWLHDFNSVQDLDNIGVDVPGWVCGRSANGIPSKLRLFGSKEALDAFLLQSGMKRIRALGVHASAPAVVPGCAEFAAVRRDNAAEKTKPAHMRRLARRGHTGAEHRPRAAALAVPLASRSTRQAFMLKLHKRAVSSESAVAFNNYGLTMQGGVPQF